MSTWNEDREPRPIGPRDDDMHDDLHDDTFDDGAEEGEMDALDRLIVASAADYHAPPATPRDAMWEAILATRAARAGADAAPSAAPIAPPDLRVVRTTAAPAPRPGAPRRWADRRWVGLAAAASLLLATGVGFGRWWGERRALDAAKGMNVPGARAGQVATLPTPDREPVTPAAAPAATPDSTTPNPDRGETRDVELGNRRGPSEPSRGAGQRLAARSVEGEGTGDAAYDVAAAQHFTSAEALLVSYRTARSSAALSDSMSVALDSRLSVWARQLLQDTRLLLDSPAGTDPRRRQLLEDLELVLAQITRLGAAGGGPTSPAAGERAAIDGTLQRGQVISRLRNVIPSGT